MKIRSFLPGSPDNARRAPSRSDSSMKGSRSPVVTKPSLGIGTRDVFDLSDFVQIPAPHG